MCGICGIYNFSKIGEIPRDVLGRMTDILAHRGPDDSGMYVDRICGLGHRRLAVIDVLSGHQPMGNEESTIWISYNGELYNYPELQKSLAAKGHRFATNSDTEVIVHAYEEYGADCVRHFNGMFAFAIWDSERECLFLARDRLGIKPLYYTKTGSLFLFASEIKALFKHPDISASANLEAVPQYLFCTALLGSATMFRDIYSLPAGHVLVFEKGSFRLQKYWDLDLDDVAELRHKSLYFYQQQIQELLEDSLRIRLMSEVPFGSLLSGGLDSSIISALAAKHLPNGLKTFTIDFQKNAAVSGGNDDIACAELMAGHLGSCHNQFIECSEDYAAISEKVAWHIEKPVELTAPSLYLLHKNLKPHITVVLSGEGADELFGGYFFFLKQSDAGRLTEFPWAPYFKEVSQLLRDDIESKTGFRERVQSSLQALLNKFQTNDSQNKILYMFIKLYLLEMLERQDKTGMAWGVEVRVPFLDHRFVELIAGIPSRLKFSEGDEKQILKQSFQSLLPARILERKKKPFPFPIDPLAIYKQKKKANALVQSDRSRVRDYFDPQRTDDFFNKRGRFAKIDNLAIFRTSHSILALESWHRAFGV